VLRHFHATHLDSETARSDSLLIRYRPPWDLQVRRPSPNIAIALIMPGIFEMPDCDRDPGLGSGISLVSTVENE